MEEVDTNSWIPHTTDFISNTGTNTEKNLWLFHIESDPYEQYDLSSQRTDIVRQLLDRLSYYNSTAVPVRYPANDPRSNPKYHNGAWVPWVD